jgi:hypothetical protein
MKLCAIVNFNLSFLVLLLNAMTHSLTESIETASSTIAPPIFETLATSSNVSYFSLAQASLDDVHRIAPAQVSQRYYDALAQKITQITPHRALIAQQYSQAMFHKGSQHPFDGDAMRGVFGQVVQYATDAPPRPEDQEAMAGLLYALYMVVMIFWLYDRTVDFRATHQLMDFLREMIKILRPMLLMPLFTKALHKMSGIMRLVFEPTP